MDELEQRLRSTLTSMAEEVSPSHRAWDEQQRRLALKSRRHRFRPVVMAAVAAAAAVLIAVPIVVIQRSNAPVGPAALPEVSSQPTPPPAPHSTSDRVPGYRSIHGETVLIPPVAVSSKPIDQANNTFLSTYAYVIEVKPGDRLLCLAQAVQGTDINGPDQLTYGEPDCVPINPPRSGQYEWGIRLVPTKFATNGSRGTWLYVMNRPAHKMLVSKAETSELIPATLKEFGKDLVLFGVYLDSTREAKAYSLYDDKDVRFFNGT